jgi:hypothetical protein
LFCDSAFQNGEHTNARPIYDEGNKYLIVAKRDIKAGEQLQNSYNQCDWCDTYSTPPDAESFQATPQIFGLYGFVEFMPQRWVIPRMRLLFDIDDVSARDDQSSGGLKVDFIVPPSRLSVSFLERRIGYLENFAKNHKDRSDVASHELSAIMSFRAAIETAFSEAVAQSEGQLSEEVWTWGDDWYTGGGEGEEDDEDQDILDPRYYEEEL